MSKYLIPFVFFIALSDVALAKEDVAGGRDHPLIQRYKNSILTAYTYTDFDQYRLANAPSSKAGNSPYQTIEGEIYTLIYKTGSNTESVIKVFRNFMQAFQKAGIEELFSCANSECGGYLVRQVLIESSRIRAYHEADPWNIGGSSDYRLWNGKLTRGNKTVYVNLIVEGKTFGNYPLTITLDIVEEAKMESNLVAINPEYLKQRLNNEGRVVLSGITFDLNSAKLRTESMDAIKAIADYLTSEKDKSVYIVGHTDNQGNYKQNLQLSQNRADSVVKTLVDSFNIDKKRLTPVGVADVSPIMSNNNESGRSKNRRVEMVTR